MTRLRFTPAEIDAMCRRVGTTRLDLLDALRSMGPSYLKKEYQKQWSPDNPTRAYCYRVSETVVRAGRTPAGFELQHKDNHYFFRHPESGEVVDLTADQCVDGFDYDDAGRGRLLPQISHGARKLAELLGWTLSGARTP